MSQKQMPVHIDSCQCGGRRVVLRDYDSGLGRESSWGTHHVTGYYALACMECGLTTFYVNNLQGLHKAVEKHPRDFQTMEQKLIEQIHKKI